MPAIGASTMRHYFTTQRALHEALVTELVSDEISDARIDETALSPGERLRECLLQFLPADDQGAPVAAWFALYAAALGPDQSALGRELLRTSAAHAQERVRDWLRVLSVEGALPTADVDHRAHLLVALVGGLCLENLTPGSPVTASEARHLLAIAVTDVVGR